MPDTALSLRETVTLVDGDPVQVDLVVDGIAHSVGALRLLCSSTPELGKAVDAPFVPLGAVGDGSGGQGYRARVSCPGLWYFWVGDNNGIAPVAAAGWPGLSPDRDANLAGKKLEAILLANQKGIEAALRAVYYPGVTIKHIIYGTASSIRDFPAILVTKPRETAQWVAMPIVREHVYSFEIFTFLFHQDEATLIPVGVQMTTAVMQILNKPEYETLELDSGLSLAFCQATEGETDETQVDEKVWCALGSVIWSGKGLKQGGV